MSATLKVDAAGAATVAGAMTLDTAAALLAEGRAALANGCTRFDLAGVEEIDSSGLAVLFGWQRAAQARGAVLGIVNAPHNLLSLAAVYGVDSLPPLA